MQQNKVQGSNWGWLVYSLFGLVQKKTCQAHLTWGEYFTQISHNQQTNWFWYGTGLGWQKGIFPT